MCGGAGAAILAVRDIDIYIYVCVHACDSTYQTLEDVVKGEARVLATSVSSDAHAV